MLFKSLGWSAATQPLQSRPQHASHYFGEPPCYETELGGQRLAKSVDWLTVAVNKDFGSIAVGSKQHGLLVNLFFGVAWPSFNRFQELIGSR